MNRQPSFLKWLTVCQSEVYELPAKPVKLLDVILRLLPRGNGIGITGEEFHITLYINENTFSETVNYTFYEGKFLESVVLKTHKEISITFFIMYIEFLLHFQNRKLISIKS